MNESDQSYSSDKDNPKSGDERERRGRARAQIQVIRDALGAENVGVATDTNDPADFSYLFRPGHILVRDRDVQRVAEELGSVYRDAGGVERGLIDGVSLYRLPSAVDVPTALVRLDEALGVGVATPDHILYVTPGTCCPATEPEEVLADADPLPPRSLDNNDGDGVFVSVVDTGWHSPAANHPRTPWLNGVTGDEETINLPAIGPYEGHGTFVAGVIRCQAPMAEIRVEGLLPVAGVVQESEMVIQLTEAIELGPDIISMSAGTTTRNNHDLLGLTVFWETQLQYLKGTVLVAAAGNDHTREPFWPAAFPWAISVGAMTPERTRAPFSNFGSWVDVYALGVNLVNAYPTGTFTCIEPPNVGQPREFDGMARWSGTSFSTPVVSGLIAARMSRTGESARHAAGALLQRARGQARPGLGPWLEPGEGLDS